MIRTDLRNTRAYTRSVELSHMRKLMKYDAAKFKQDWELCVALAALAAQKPNNEHLLGMMDAAFMRIQAYRGNNPHALPFEETA